VVLEGEGLVDVQCTFDKAAKSRLAQLTQGQMVNIIGKCTGKMLNVQLDECRFE
jgi:hypothetical protein